MQTSSAMRFVFGLTLASSPAFAQALKFEGAEFAVNTYSVGSQREPSVACAPGVGCVVAWESQGQDGDSSGIFAQRYDASGSPLGGELQVNTTTAGSQGLPDACMDAAGGFVVAWWGAGTGDSNGAFARRYAAGGSPIGGEFLLNTYTTGSQAWPNVACFGDSGFVATWSSEQDAYGAGIFGQRFDAGGLPVGAEFQVNTTTAGNQLRGGVAASPDGGFTVVWDDQADPEIQYRAQSIRGRKYDSSGAPLGSQFLIGQARGCCPPPEASWVWGADVAGDEAGGIAVAWSEGYFGCDYYEMFCYSGADVFVRRYDAAGASVDVAYAASAWARDVASTSYSGLGVAAGSSNFVVAWDSSTYEYSETVSARSFDFSATAEGNALALNMSMAGARRAPAIAHAGDGRYLAGWVADSQDAGSPGVFARYLCDDGDLDGACDAVDPCPHDPVDDADADGVCGDADNCPGVVNAGQQDGDGDGVGDACDACPGFDDALNADGDAIPDGCDACPLDDGNDADGDGLCGNVDNCPSVANSGQDDSEGDGVGDACDLCPLGDDADDADDDGVADACDLCPNPDGESTLRGRAKLVIKKIDTDPVTGNETLKLKGAFDNVGPWPRPDLHGARIAMGNVAGMTLVQISLPAGDYGGSETAGWTSTNNGWTFRDARATSSSGIRSLRMRNGATGINTITVSGRDLTLPIATGDIPLRIAIELGDVSVSEGTCAEKHFIAAQCALNTASNAVVCRD